MSHDNAKGRADAAKGTYDPPSHQFCDTGFLESNKDYERIMERKEDYREGYHDKKNELRDK